MSTYLFLIFEVHCTVSRYDICLEEYMDLSPSLISGTKLPHCCPLETFFKFLTDFQYFQKQRVQRPKYGRLGSKGLTKFCSPYRVS